MPKIIRVAKARVRKNGQGEVLPNRVCELDGTEIKVGDPYKHVSIKTGPSSSLVRVRCNNCPDWQPFELSNAMWARVEQAVHNFRQSVDYTSEESLKDCLDGLAEEIRELAEERQQSADAIVDGFGSETEQASALREDAEALEQFATDIEDVEISEPTPEDVPCDDCEGTGQVEGDEGAKEPCETCEGSGEVTPEDLSESEHEEWTETVSNAVDDVLDNIPDISR